MPKDGCYKKKSIHLNMCGGFYMHESSQNEHLKENQLFFEKKHEYKDKLPFPKTTITRELKLD